MANDKSLWVIYRDTGSTLFTARIYTFTNVSVNPTDILFSFDDLETVRRQLPLDLTRIPLTRNVEVPVGMILVEGWI